MQTLQDPLYSQCFVWLQAAVISRFRRSTNLLQRCQSRQPDQRRRQVAARSFSFLPQGAHYSRRHKEGPPN